MTAIPRPTSPSRLLAAACAVHRNRAVAVGAVLLVAVVLLSIFAATVAVTDPGQIRPRLRLRAPDWAYPFGTDALGRDIFARVLHGGQISLLVGLLSAAVATFVGTLVGLVAGSSRLLDAIVMRAIDGLMAIPSLLLAIAIVALIGPNLFSIVAAISISEVPRVVRLVRGVVLTVREEPFVRAAEGLGIPTPLILLRHILPSCMAPLVVQTTHMFAAAILIEAALGFLGVGFPPELPTWGNVLAEGRAVFQRAPWTIIFPGLFLGLSVLGVNILGDGLRDRLDPRLARTAKAA
ncbi:peptide/nickel transport system permease protein [Stella humosa]|uniref:Peptide/nickel transport system permease protein n=1 Tax=Stella humosa TaxID=94 RepID=A0A3N1KYL0_9PROT|nr:ABC transporter permease [Stella humosa]ROP83710.1 peptide/nickel transport system permease protein [Stella humosa]BBK33018.1 binding-protein-dependent transport system membrane protein [Stella humosa]